MKKNKLILTVAVAACAMSLAACGGSKTAETTAASTTETTAAGATDATTAADGTSESTAETIAADDPEVTALENTEVPEEPGVDDMGKIELADLSTIEVTTTPKMEITDDDVDQQIEYTLAQSLAEIDGAAVLDDTVNIDYTGTIDGKEFDGGSATGYDLKLGSGQFIEGFEDQLVGHKKGDKVTVKVTFPADYSNADLAGKDAEFAVTVNSVQRAPELTDEWVKNSSESKAQNIAEYKTLIKTMLLANADYNYHSGIQQDALSAIVEKSKIYISDDLKNYAEAYVTQSQIAQASQYGFGLSDMLNMYGMTVAEFKEEMSSQAADYAGQKFVIAEIAKQQNIQSSDELIDKLAANMTELSGTEYNKVLLITQFGKEAVEQEAVNDAVLDYIESQIKITEQAETSAAATDAAAETTTAETTTAAQ